MTLRLGNLAPAERAHALRTIRTNATDDEWRSIEAAYDAIAVVGELARPGERLTADDRAALAHARVAIEAARQTLDDMNARLETPSRRGWLRRLLTGRTKGDT